MWQGWAVDGWMVTLLCICLLILHIRCVDREAEQPCRWIIVPGVNSPKDLSTSNSSKRICSQILSLETIQSPTYVFNSAEHFYCALQANFIIPISKLFTYGPLPICGQWRWILLLLVNCKGWLDVKKGYAMVLAGTLLLSWPWSQGEGNEERAIWFSRIYLLEIIIYASLNPLQLEELKRWPFGNE